MVLFADSVVAELLTPERWREILSMRRETVDDGPAPATSHPRGRRGREGRARMRRPWPLPFDVAALRPTETATTRGGRILNAATSPEDHGTIRGVARAAEPVFLHRT
jgi:hypothetical protein